MKISLLTFSHFIHFLSSLHRWRCCSLLPSSLLLGHSAMLLQPRLLPRVLFISSKPRFSPFSTHASQITIPLPSQPILSPLTPDSDLDPSTQNPITLPLQKLFVPPETQLPGDATSASAHTRVLTGSNIVLGPYAYDSQVVNAEFVKSSVRTADCPSDGLPEFALVGRSNVGKSSLLNSLVRRKKLALTSKKPGKTQCINHFRINDKWYLVDLPGYGYAAAPHESRLNWEEFTKDYFLKRETLVSVFLLIDASIPAKKIDLDYASWLGQNQIPMTIIFTKCDKRKKKKNGGRRPEENAETFQSLISEFFESTPPWIMTSTVTNMGRDEILLHMSQLRNYWLKH
ncbi:P-loop containing nucleoside triphosphate hydrolases superfamily protein [Rhynchospora pubera]|uniref:P-loop containing nucleoside triphosphate hydrolases superfamily protein n=1 Tax=Rhynchospora pubera TaxID=906938 RepID=A0AAV8EPB9_9POAL|nr:P-loop containing nucleoside triphosphate hydrolases superfamily protein [Rhynchospora pubera]